MTKIVAYTLVHIYVYMHSSSVFINLTFQACQIGMPIPNIKTPRMTHATFWAHYKIIRIKDTCAQKHTID